MRVIKRDGDVAQCEAQGTGRKISLFLLQHEDVAEGDYVMVHVSYAIQKISQTDAQAAWDLFDAMFAAGVKAGQNA
jgi:hydrogenase expression/formation protein HypC